MNDITTKETTAYVVERWVHASFGTHTSRWQGFDYAQVVSHNLVRQMRASPADEKIATRVLREVSKARPFETFRLSLETIVVTRKPDLVAEPRHHITPLDIEAILDGATIGGKGSDSSMSLAHDGFREFNGAIPAMIELRLNPFHFGAYRASVVREALRQWKSGTFEDKWVPLHPAEELEAFHGADSFKKKMRKISGDSLINFAQQAEICPREEGFGNKQKIIYYRHDYADGENTGGQRYPSLERAMKGPS